MNYHSGFFENHEIYKINNDKKEIFNPFCKEENLSLKLEFFWKSHNKLCCIACISKIKIKNYGMHKDCKIFPIEKIKDEKRNKLKENIKILEDLSNNIEQSIDELIKLVEKINNDNIQKSFTFIRNVLNQREDEFLLEVNKMFSSMLYNEDIIKESKKLPNKKKIYLKNRKLIDKEIKEKK